jgi:hypothetical protein
MIPMAISMPMYYSKFFTDIPFILGIAIGLYVLRPSTGEARAYAAVGSSGT